jgi:ATP-dependent 26S proteasome regulatory subunit
MDDATLTGLEAALSATPGNGALVKVLLQGYLDAEAFERGATRIEGLPPSLWADAPLARLAADVLLEAGKNERAVELLKSPDAETQLMKAKALLLLERRAEGLQAYQAAVAANPTLEDKELEHALGLKVREAGTAGVTKLRVIANDATEDDEATHLLKTETKKVFFKDVGGLDDVKEQIRKRIILPFQKPSLFDKFKKRIGGGILMYGPPGCGKTLLARATAGECEAVFLSVAISDVLDMYIGESERKLHAVFEKARSKTPAVLFFDELEALGGRRQYTRESTSSKLVSQFLAEMDGFAQNNKGVLILGATNVPWAVDSAFRRPGRFDRVQFVPPPDQAARESILKLQLADRPVSDKIDVASLAKKTGGFTGADLENLVETAADLAIDRSLKDGAETPIDGADLVAALKDVKPTALEWLTTARNYARYANESGHYDDVLAWLDQHGKG